MSIVHTLTALETLLANESFDDDKRLAIVGALHALADAQFLMNAEQKRRFARVRVAFARCLRESAGAA